MRVSVCVPSHDHVSANFSFDLAKLMGFTAAKAVGPGAIEALAIHSAAGTLIHTARQKLALVALSEGADYLFWLDSDMRFPKDILLRLLNHNEDIVGINYSTRGIPPKFVAIKQLGIDEGEKSLRCVTTEDSTGLEEVAAIGFGAVLIHRSVFEKLHDPHGPEGPWFQFPWIHSKKQSMGEDVFFCKLAREAGFKVLVDHDLSKECAHIGELEYVLGHVDPEGPEDGD
jgi:hypothetical protein